jgi:hypothetical protein
VSVQSAEAVPERTVWLTYPGPEATEAKARIVERSAQWRRSGALKGLALWLLIPVVVFVPPHIPWVLIVLAVGAIRAWGRWNEHATLLSLRGPCPKCGTDQQFAETGRMKFPHKVTCASCRWDLQVHVAPPAGVTSR